MEKLIDRALKELRYICCFTSIAKEFEEEKGWLQAERTTVGQRVNVAKQIGEDVQANVLFWEKEADKLIQEDTKTKQKCFFGLCPHCIWRYKRGKELTNKKDRIKILMETGKELAIRAPLPDVERYSSQHYISCKSRESKYNELLDALKDDNNYIIGLQGMGGTGKTTLAKEVGKKLKQSKQFTSIIVTTVSFSPDIKKIQDDIAGPLGMKFADCSESDRPKKLWKRLTNGEKILLILDDVWGDIDFEEIGIPYSDNHKGCRVLVTSRNLVVCNKLGCSKTIKLEPLPQDDAWKMFKRHAGLTETSTESLLDKGRKIADECKGLPIAIAVIASSLKGKQHREEWDLTLKSLQKHESMHGVDDELAKIYKCLKFSYDNMKDEKSKTLFLLCSIFREDEEIPVERLTRLSIGAGLFGENYGSYDDARNEVVISKEKLLNSCLLLEVDEETVKMYDMVRGAAQRIANKEIQTIKLYDKNQKAIVEREKNVKYLLWEGKLKDVLSCKFDSSKLEILIVISQLDDGDCHDEKTEVPNSFFENISGLRVFHLFHTIYRATISLPLSIQLLKNIRSLLFNNVDLGDISILGKLQSLETLDFDWCKINEFPEELAKLPNLRLLKLRSCAIIRKNPFKVFEECSSLQELYFINSFNNCCREISLPKLRRFVLDDNLMSVNDSLSNCVSLLHQDDEHLLTKKQLKDCIQEVEVLRLTRIWWEWANIIPEIVPMDHGMNDLVELRLSFISQLKCLIDTKHDNSQVTAVFSNLVVLELEEMESLEEFCNGPLSFDSLKRLEKLTITRCNRLRSLFTCNINLFNLKTKIPLVSEDQQQQIVIDTGDHRNGGNNWHNVFPKLKEVKVEGCMKLEYIFGHYSDAHQNHNEIHLQLPTLECLYIKDLPSLVAMCPQHYRTTFPVLEDLVVDKCSNFAIKSIDDLTIPLVSGSLDTTIKKEFSGNMDHFFALKSLRLYNCKVENIYFLNEVPEGQIMLGLKYIHLYDLPTTTCLLVGPENSFSLNYLIQINIFRCEKLEFVFSTSILRCLPQLLILRIEECTELKLIIKDDLENEKSINFQSTNTYFPKLEVLGIVNCNKLKCAFMSSVCKELPKLKVLIIREAYELQEIFTIEGDDQKFEIPNLEIVAFINLPNLGYTQGMHFQAVKYRHVQNCHQLSLTSTSKSNDNIFDFLKDYDIYEELLDFVLLPLRNVYEGSPSPEITRKSDIGVEAETSPEHVLTSAQVLMNEQSMDKKHSLGETDTTLKPQLDGSTIPEKTLAANSSTILETMKEPPIESVAPKQKEDGDFQIATMETNDEVADASMKVSSNIEEQFPKDDKIIASESKLSPTITSPKASQFPKDDKIIASESKPSPTIISPKASQFPKDDKIIASESQPSPTITSPKASQFPKDKIIASESKPSLTITPPKASQFPKDDKIIASESQPSPTITSPKASQFPKDDKIIASESQPSPTITSPKASQFPKDKIIASESQPSPTITSPKASQFPKDKIIASESKPSLTITSLKASQFPKDDKIIASESKPSLTITSPKASQFPKDDKIIASESKPSPTITSPKASQFPKDDKIIASESKPFPTITSPKASQFPSVSFKGDLSQIIEDLSSPLFVTRELEQLVSKKHLDYENLSLLTDFLVKHPSILLKNTSLSNRYKGYAYNCLAELLKFLQTHNVLDVLGSNHSEFVELLQDVRKWGFDKDWLDGVERRTLFFDIEVSQDTLQKLSDSKQEEVPNEVEVLRLKTTILSQCAEDLKHQLTDLKHRLTSSKDVLESIIHQKTVLSAPIFY